MKNRKSIRILSECAIMIALGTVLSLNKIIKLPFGGSVTLVSMFRSVSYPSSTATGSDCSPDSGFPR